MILALSEVAKSMRLMSRTVSVSERYWSMKEVNRTNWVIGEPKSDGEENTVSPLSASMWGKYM